HAMLPFLIFSSRRRHTRSTRDWSSDVCSSDLSRPAYYEAASALERSGLEGLVPARPGPRGPHKLTGQILTWAEQQLAASPGLRRSEERRVGEEGRGGWGGCPHF